MDYRKVLKTIKRNLGINEEIEEIKLIDRYVENIIEEKFSYGLENLNVLGDIYEKNILEDVKKFYGRVYTPNDIVDMILSETVDEIDVTKNPFVKILDPSCGCGHFLIRVYDLLYEKFKANISALNDKFHESEYEIDVDFKITKVKGKDYWNVNNIHRHILKNCIFGCDMDVVAVYITMVNLYLKNANTECISENIIVCDSLINWEKEETVINTNFWRNRFDYVVGNPPYIGHKSLDIDYKKWLLKEYNEVFKDKSDISYCFFKKILDVLKEDGKAGIITTRYFMESPTGRNLRSYLKNNCCIDKIIDFYGYEVFKGVGVASAIFVFRNTKIEQNEIIVKKLEDKSFEEFKINQASLSDNRWIIVSKEKREMLNKINEKTTIKLGDIVENFQGIITGCDKAFVLTKEEMYGYNIESEITERWIKNKNVERYYVSKSKLRLIYADYINDEGDYKNAVVHINNYKERLIKRRECIKGIRKWHHLQWGRNPELFKQKKVVYPYKSQNNRFAVDYDNCFFSADVYSFILKKEFEKDISLEYLVALLNSQVYQDYFQLFAKKMGEKIYDYYPNTVMELKIFMDESYDKIESYGKEIIRLTEIAKKSTENKALEISEDLENIESYKINLIIKKYFDI